ncbi:MAG: long-chain fatty acid--CoA ligase [bacterium]
MEKLTDLLRERSRISPNRPAYLVRRNRRWATLTWAEVDRRADYLAAGLIASGLLPGDAVSILGRTCLEWALCDLAVLRAGGVSIGIYPTLTGEQVAYILKDSSTRLLFVENGSSLRKVQPYLDQTPSLASTIFWEKEDAAPPAAGLSELEEEGREALSRDPELTRRREAEIRADGVALIIYTSGTTGPPKGAMLTHANVMAQLEMLSALGEVNEQDIMMFFLPLSHVGERIPGHYNRIYRGVPAAFVEDINRILDDVREIRPTVFGSVPRIFEKAHRRILSEADRASPIARGIFRWAERVGRACSRLERSRQRPPAALRLERRIADRIVFRKVREAFGGRVRFFISAAAPISLEILEFFHAAGMLVLEGYGQTEVSCFCTLNRPEDYRLGSVGKPLAGVDLRLAEDGEILVRGPIVFKGYRNQPELTAETLEASGWIHTGDIGRLDAEGFLYITGRKKEIIITSGGKNVTPSNIENLLLNNPMIEQALVHGDRRKYLTALLALNPERLKEWACRKGADALGSNELLRHPGLLEEVQTIVDQVNVQVARFESIKRFALLPRLLEVEKAELTPTLKIRRRVVEEHFKGLLDSLYEERPL